METAFAGSDADGAWDWKSAYDACEAATVLFLRKFGPVDARTRGIARRHAADAGQDCRSPSHPHATLRGKPGAAAVQHADRARMGRVDRGGDHSRLTSSLNHRPARDCFAILAELSGASLVLNELAETRAGLLAQLFPAIAVTRFDAAQIDDHLGVGIAPSVVLMNPPFSAVANVDRRMADAALRHISSALARLADGGRLVAITGANCAPDNPAWRDAFVDLQQRGQVVFSAAIDGAMFARHGTTMDTRLTVIDKRAADDACAFPASPGVATDVATLLGWIKNSVPSRLPVALPQALPSIVRSLPGIGRAQKPVIARPSSFPAQPPQPEAIELAYQTARLEAGRGWRHHRRAVRSLQLAVDPDSRRASASDQAGAVGGDGVSGAAEAELSSASRR